MKRYISKSQGFTLIELMITIGIIGILAAIAVPSYQNYTRRAYFSEVIQDTAPFKTGVAECYQNNGALAGCNGGSNHIPADIAAATGAVATLTTANGVITVTPVAQNGITAANTYILTPTVTNNIITWAVSGGCVAAGYC